MAFGIYVHIPYCLQRCRYCDFATFEAKTLEPASNYVDKVLLEIAGHKNFVPYRQMSSLYFGGGTPSLIEAEDIVRIMDALANHGFERSPNFECTIEINPATIDKRKMDLYLRAGVNRFSVGAQTFNDTFLQDCGRKHTAKQTLETLDLLKEYKVNYSLDLLFALPRQSMADLEADLYQIGIINPPHVSAYCLTVPEGHPMSFHRPADEKQVEMFGRVRSQLETIGLEQYEISNYARPGFESKHNQTYWSNSPYWGIGLSAHSFFPEPKFGVRFWNSKDWNLYDTQARTAYDSLDSLPKDQTEFLTRREALFDYLYTHLRTSSGVRLAAIRDLFGTGSLNPTKRSLEQLRSSSLIDESDGIYRLTWKGQLLNNQTLEALLFDPEDLGSVQNKHPL